MIQVEGLKKEFRTTEGVVLALRGIGFGVPKGSFFTLLGPSGCGKTTTLRCVAGLERPDGGEISINEKKVFSSQHGIFVPGNKRDIGMVFQSYAIWPHMTVFKNVAYPLRARKRPRGEIRDRVRKALTLVGLEELEDRLAPRLSGGQQQRVALARALVAEPQVLLLDEPLSNLDAKLRSQMRWELKDLQRRLGTTTLYVTHDQVEALAISDHIALMNAGTIIQIGTPDEIYGSPANEFAADFIGAANIIPAEIIVGPDAEGRTKVQTPIGDLYAMCRWKHEPTERQVLVAFRPEGVSLYLEKPETGENNILRGVVEGFTYLGESTEYHVTLGDQKIQARAPAGVRLKSGLHVYLQIHRDTCLVIRRGQT
jgi:iron(III) transport system ATP-binding protein